MLAARVTCSEVRDGVLVTMGGPGTESPPGAYALVEAGEEKISPSKAPEKDTTPKVGDKETYKRSNAFVEETDEKKLRRQSEKFVVESAMSQLIQTVFPFRPRQNLPAVCPPLIVIVKMSSLGNLLPMKKRKVYMKRWRRAQTVS